MKRFVHRFRAARVLLMAASLGAGGAALAAELGVPLPVVSVIAAAPRELVERAVVTGTLVPRDEVLVAPELDGVRVTEVLVEEGDHVAKGQVMARLSREMLDTQIAQNAASLARAQAAIAQGKSGIDQADASALEAKLALERAQTLSRSGNATEATLEQRVSASRSADGRLSAARNGLTMAEADLSQTRAQRAELELKLARTEIRAPVDGIVSRKAARVGASASTAGEPLFRLIAHGTIELEGEVTETGLGKLAVAAPAAVDIGGAAPVRGRVRAIYPEIDRTTRLGKVRITLDPDPALRIGAFARGTVELARRTGIALPLSALLFSSTGEAGVLVVVDGRVEGRKVSTGLSAGGSIEIVEGVRAGDAVVARAGAFLRPGDAVRAAAPVPAPGSAKL